MNWSAIFVKLVDLHKPKNFTLKIFIIVHMNYQVPKVSVNKNLFKDLKIYKKKKKMLSNTIIIGLFRSVQKLINPIQFSLFNLIQSNLLKKSNI